MWQETERIPDDLDRTAIARTVTAARRRNYRVVIEPPLTEMRLNAVGNYRTRLMDAGHIEPAGYGLVLFAIPGLREYMTAHPSMK